MLNIMNPFWSEVSVSVLLSLPQYSSDKFKPLWPFFQASSADDQPAVSDLLQQLQEVRDEASATKEQLGNYKESCSRLQEDLQVCHVEQLVSVHTVCLWRLVTVICFSFQEKTATIERLQGQLQKVGQNIWFFKLYIFYKPVFPQKQACLLESLAMTWSL